MSRRGLHLGKMAKSPRLGGSLRSPREKTSKGRAWWWLEEREPGIVVGGGWMVMVEQRHQVRNKKGTRQGTEP